MNGNLVILCCWLYSYLFLCCVYVVWWRKAYDGVIPHDGVPGPAYGPLRRWQALRRSQRQWVHVHVGFILKLRSLNLFTHCWSPVNLLLFKKNSRYTVYTVVNNGQIFWQLTRIWHRWNVLKWSKQTLRDDENTHAFARICCPIAVLGRK